jgi:hypothetical protein
MTSAPRPRHDRRFLPAARSCRRAIAVPATLLLLAAAGWGQVCTYTWRGEIGQPGLNLANATYDAVRWDPDGAGPQGEVIVVCGNFGQAGGQPAISIAAWDQSTGLWSELGGGLRRNGGWADVRALAVLPDGSLVAAGLIDQAGQQSVNGIARFDGTNWSPLGQGLQGAARDLLVLPNGHLVVAGDRVKSNGITPTLSGVLVWDGSIWYSLQSPLEFNFSEVRHLEPAADGGFIASGKFFSWMDPNLSDIARWSPSAAPQGVWSDVGGGLPNGVYGVNGAVELSSGEVVACGDLRYDGGQIYHAARWEGTSWQRMDTGIDRRPTSLALLPNGGLFIGTGWSSGVSGGCSSLCHLYDWTGTEWEIEAWVCSNVIQFIVEVLSDGDLVLGGIFWQFNNYLFNQQGQVIGGTSYNVGNVMRFEPGKPPVTQHPASLSDPPAGPFAFDVAAAGATQFQWQRRANSGVWLDLAEGLNVEAATGLALTAAGAETDSLVVTDVELGNAGPAIELRARAGDGCGFDFSAAATLTSESGPPCTPTTYCTAGTSASGCQALLGATGVASATAPSGFVVTASGVEGQKDGLFFFGTNGQQANLWGNGTSYQCVVPPVKRCGLLAGPGTVGACDGSLELDLNAYLRANPVKDPGIGAVVQIQLWYRDPANTSNQSTSLSNALEFCVGQ